MGNWDDGLTPEQRREWDAFVKHAREDTYQKMDQSAFVMSLVPSGEPDIKFAVELGLAIMMDKPIVAVVMKGAEVPARLRSVADGVVELDEDLDTEAGRQEVYEKVKPYIERFAS